MTIFKNAQAKIHKNGFKTSNIAWFKLHHLEVTLIAHELHKERPR